MKLSEAGKLYLEDYILLEQAKADVDQFLNSLAETVYDRLKMEIDVYGELPYTGRAWLNQSTKGRIDLDVMTSDENTILRPNKADISIIYKDIRHYTKLTSSATIRISVWTPDVAKSVRQHLEVLCARKEIESCYQDQIVAVDLDDLQSTADEIVGVMMSKFTSIVDLLKVEDATKI